MGKTRKPLVPMGAITGHPTRDELREYLGNYYNAGIDQFLIYPRSGLEVEYMGSEWLEICRHIIEYCAEHDMSVWLYDEYNWPSGKCKGKVIKTDPDFASKKLVAFTDRNFCGIESPDAPGQEFFWSEISIPIYADLLNPDAVDCFINLTHGAYYQHFGQHFGTTIKGLFSDEPSIKYATFQPVKGSVLELPYYTGMKQDYREATGRDLIEDLEAYLNQLGRENMWYDLFAVLGKRFRQVYMEKVRDWCTAHNILYTGHLMSEPYPKTSILASGQPADAIRAFSMPGIDEISSRSNFDNIEWNTFKLLESAMNGPRTEALAELFALGPSNMTLAKMRELIYLAAVHGVNHFVTAVSALDARGNVDKSLYYNPVAPAQPWFKYISSLNDSAAKAAELTRKTSTASIALRYPQRVYCEKWSHKHEPEFKVNYTELIKALINAQWEFRVIGDCEKAANHYKVILDLNSQGAVEEISGTRFSDIHEILSFLEHNLSRRTRLRFRDNKTVGKVLLKSYDDGSICVVNTSMEHLRDVTLGDEFFDMPPRDVAIFPRMSRKEPQHVLNLMTHPMTATPVTLNSMRCIFPANRELKIEVEHDVHAKLALREYNGAAKVRIDDLEIDASRPCKDLPNGLNTLYIESDIFRLTAGIHRLQLVSEVNDFPYLPLAFVLGNFAMGGDHVIRQLPQNEKLIDSYFSDNLNQYVGTVIFRDDNIDLSDYDAITCEYRGMAVELSIGGESMGSRLWAPFTWEIPECLRKTGIKIELSITSSVGPLFGNYLDHQDSDIDWLTQYWPGETEL